MESLFGGEMSRWMLDRALVFMLSSALGTSATHATTPSVSGARSH